MNRQKSISIKFIIVLMFLFCLIGCKNYSITTKLTLEKVLNVKELHTIEYVYNSYVIVTPHIDDYWEDIAVDVSADETDVPTETEKDRRYAISYRGIVRAGIDEPPTVQVEGNTIYVDVPNAKILEYNVSTEAETMKFLYFKNKYKKNPNIKKHLSICRNDLRSKVINNQKILYLANENAKETIKALCMPFKKSSSYNFVVEGEKL